MSSSSAAPASASSLPRVAAAHLNPVSGFVGAVGNTPLIRLNRLSEETGCEILGKAEFMQPGGSVKDRAALFVVKDAEEKGAWKRHLASIDAVITEILILTLQQA